MRLLEIKINKKLKILPIYRNKRQFYFLSKIVLIVSEILTEVKQ